MPRAAAAGLVVGALLVALLAVSLARPAPVSRALVTGIFDDAHILDGDRASTFDTLAELRVRLIRVTLWWGGPKGVARSRPPADATDPADPAYDWAAYDRVVRAAASRDIEVMFTILGTPSWESGSPAWNRAPRAPADLRDFAAAAARRYGAGFAPDGEDVLPRVRYWTAWNEPNSPVFLRPQYRRSRGHWIVQSAIDYARICNAVVEGVKGASAGASVACGVTAPRGNNRPGSARASVSPLVFARAMRSAGARGFDAYAHNPYYGSRSETPLTPPARGPAGQPPTAVTLGNLGTLVSDVTRLFGRVRIWITEYGYQTNPPDRLFGVSWAKQASYLRQAWTLARANPRVDVFLWFLLQDEAPLGRWQSGLLTVDGRHKPAFAAFASLQ